MLDPALLERRLAEYYLARYALDVAIATLERGGVASNPRTREFLPPTDAWSFPKYPQRTAILPPEADLPAEIEKFVAANEACWGEADCWLGTWINPHTGHYYLDVATSCADLEQARRLARDISQREGRKVVALYNSQRGQTVYLWDDVTE